MKKKMKKIVLVASVLLIVGLVIINIDPPMIHQLAIDPPMIHQFAIDPPMSIFKLFI